MGGPILDFFQSVLGVPSHSNQDASDKRIGLAWAFPQKRLKFLPRQWDSSAAFGPGFLLLPEVENAVL